MMPDDLFIACCALARLVRMEYPSARPLDYICEVWGGASKSEIDAVRKFEDLLAENMRATRNYVDGDE